jgi:hypothetical protein
MKPQNVTGLCTIQQAQKMLGCSRSKIYALRDQGRLELVKFDHRTKVTQSSLEKLLAEIKARVLAAPRDDEKAKASNQ